MEVKRISYETFVIKCKVYTRVHLVRITEGLNHILEDGFKIIFSIQFPFTLMHLAQFSF